MGRYFFSHPSSFISDKNSRQSCTSSATVIQTSIIFVVENLWCWDELLNLTCRWVTGGIPNLYWLAKVEISEGYKKIFVVTKQVFRWQIFSSIHALSKLSISLSQAYMTVSLYTFVRM
jgi:hypothetical protein